MHKGFSLIESVITLAVSAVLLSVALPNIHRSHEEYKLRGLAAELKQFFSRARSEALTRHEDLWITLNVAETHWRMSLVKSEPSSDTDIEEILAIGGDEHILQASWQQLKFSGKTGKVLENSRLTFSSGINHPMILKLITHHVTGRVRICAEGASFYGYPVC